jgi:hypothetical protein
MSQIESMIVTTVVVVGGIEVNHEEDESGTTRKRYKYVGGEACP